MDRPERPFKEVDCRVEPLHGLYEFNKDDVGRVLMVEMILFMPYYLIFLPVRQTVGDKYVSESLKA